MSTFEIVKGVKGYCLVLDGTRICGPKPWGGGRTVDTFRTDEIYEVIDKDEYRKLLEENAKLREWCSDFWKWADPPFALKSGTFDEYMALVERAVELGVIK